jgi:imidazolonepropionase-like amidohydrolase
MNRFMFLSLLFPLVSGCKTAEHVSSTYTAFTGANIIDGSGTATIEDAVLLIQNGRVLEVGRAEEITIPEGATVKDVSGKTIIPGIVNGHGHVGKAKGIEGGHYSRENIPDNLSIYARYGITTVVSLGDDGQEAVPLRHVNDTIPAGRARLFIAGEVISGKTPAEAVAVVERNHEMGVDFMKIRVDDNLGTTKKMPKEVYQAVINRSHELGYKVATHIYYLDDAKKLLEAGSDLIAHSVRDLPVDDAFIQLMKKKGVGYCPTLTREVSTFVYGDTAGFFSDPFFTREYDEETIQPLQDPARQLQVRNNKNGRIYRQQLPFALANLKALSDAGVPIVFGTDSGVPTRFMGYFEHMEMLMMAEAGVTPIEIIVSATRDAAEYFGLKDLGTLSAGHWADFIVLDEDPLADIRNVRKISGVYIGGEAVKLK